MFNQRADTLIADSKGNCIAQRVRQVGKRASAPILVGLLLALTLSGCGGSGGGADVMATSVTPSPTPPAPLPSAAAPIEPSANVVSEHGRFVGTVRIGDTDYFGDALITVDGAIRLYVGGPYVASGAMQLAKPENSAQFVGTVDGHGGRVSGSGVIIGQGCSAPKNIPFFCENTLDSTPGLISFEAGSGGIHGEIALSEEGRNETWLLDLKTWDNYYQLPARLEHLVGTYKEELAEFAPEGDVTLSVDGAGRLFFQSPRSACTGNGTLAPHRDGRFNVYNVALTIEGCSGPYAYLNGVYEGLSTTSASGYWDYDSSLRTWLSKRAGDPSQPAALIMWGRPL